MNGNKDVVAHFTAAGVSATSSEPAAEAHVLLRSSLRAARARGEVTLNSRVALTAAEGIVEARVPVRAGDNLVEARLVSSSAAGLWRFDLQAATAGNASVLSVIAGDVVAATPDAVTFRVRGEPGERVAFVLRFVPAPRGDRSAQ
jgi:hypothetical protein